MCNSNQILSTLRRNLNNSMTCKIRLLDSVASTIDLLKTIELAGASAVAIHSRYIPDRPRDPAKVSASSVMGNQL